MALVVLIDSSSRHCVVAAFRTWHVWISQATSIRNHCRKSSPFL